MSESSSLTVGMVGFGGRLPLADALSKLCNQPAISKLHIFWNQPSPEIEIQLSDLKSKFQKVEITLSEVNTGSAGGYAKVIEKFRDSDTSHFLLLLDDDLYLEPDCIEQLLATAATSSSDTHETLFLAYRSGLPELADLVERNLGIRRPRPGCCVGFHFLNLIKPNIEPMRYDKNSGTYSIGSAPWGGLLIPRPALEKLGLPREDFFLYAEDYELTSRFVWNHGEIILVPTAKIRDNDIAWNAVGGKMNGLKRRMLKLPEVKVFHEVRNRNFIARRYYTGLLPIYMCNKYLFLAAAYALGIWHGKLSRARLIHRAINDGELMAEDSLPQDRLWPR